jgi:hypothetical protein
MPNDNLIRVVIWVSIILYLSPNLDALGLTGVLAVDLSDIFEGI